MVAPRNKLCFRICLRLASAAGLMPCAALMTQAENAAAFLEVVPAQPPALAVLAGGVSIVIDAPDLFTITTNRPAPGALWDGWSPLAPWPGKGKDGLPGAWALTPRYDDDGSLILGGLFRQLLPETVCVSNPGDGAVFERGRDFEINTEWAQVAAVGERLGEAGKTELRVEARAAMQRIDLLQVPEAGGRVSLKRGVSRLVCPVRPDPDDGFRAVATVYVAPWRRDGTWKVLPEDILPVRPKPPVEPIRPGAVERTLARLQAGEPVSIAFMGDSITLGAEAGRWWSDDSLTWRGRVMRSLRARFPKSEITEIPAFRGGRGIAFGMEVFEETVRPAKPDLVFMALGINDASAPVGQAPVTPLEDFARHFEELVARARGAGMEVVVLTTMQANPFDASGTAGRWPAYAAVQREAAEKHGAGVADTFAEWMNLTFLGIPPFSQLHNWINHPGAGGHALFAEVVLRFFPEPRDTGLE